MKNILVCGAGGFIGSHLVRKLRNEGNYVVGVDLKHPEYSDSLANVFLIGDLTNQHFCETVFEQIDNCYFDEIYQLAADMGGAGYIFTGENDADVMYNSAMINLNILDLCVCHGVGKIFYSSSACMYPEYNQEDPNNPNCAEDSAYPADPDSEYGWEKLFSERLYLAHARNHDIDVRIARFHNIYGPEGTWYGGREKFPAAICRKVIVAEDGDAIEIWGDGEQTRSFLYIDRCLEGVQRLMNSDFQGPVNIGSEEMISVNDLARKVIEISGKNLTLNHVDGPLGVRGRNSDNRLIQEKLGWNPNSGENASLDYGIRKTYDWIKDQHESVLAAEARLRELIGDSV